MSIEVALRALLLGDAAIAAEVGDRVYPMNLPQDAVLPAVTYRVISHMSIYTMQEDSGLNRPRFQVTAWGEDYDDALELAELVGNRLSGFRGSAAGVIIPGIFKEDERDRFEEGYENVSNKYGKEQDFYVWYNA